MYGWRVTKYNPQYRNEKGHYLKDEWTCFSEIGKIINGKKFTLKEYEAIEHKYIQAILLFMECLDLNSLVIEALEKKNNPFLSRSLSAESKIFKGTRNKMLASKEKLVDIIKLILRNKLWCKFESPMMYVHFGWDYTCTLVVQNHAR